MKPFSFSNKEILEYDDVSVIKSENRSTLENII